MRAAVIGCPIAHSLSPLCFSYIAEIEKHSLTYQSYEVNEKDCKYILNPLRNEKTFLGFNVTHPLKELFIKDIDYVSPEVLVTGALNVLHFKDSKIGGFNTDIIGIQRTLEKQKFSVEGKTCFIFGAGGAAKAVAYVLGSFGALNVIVYNRSNKNYELTDKFSKIFIGTNWIPVSLLDCDLIERCKVDLIINSTSLGMMEEDSDIDFFKPMEKLKFSNDALAFDLIYTDEETLFLSMVKKLELVTVNGLGMFVAQALATWKIWIGDLKDEKVLHEKLENFLKGIIRLKKNKKPIYLTGFMGVGKSSVGAELSKLIGRQFSDVDHLIEGSSGATIPEIFELKGESFFRKLEHDLIVDFSSSVLAKNSVVSLGGGALMNDDSFYAITRSGILVYLSAKEGTLIERIERQDQARPLLSLLSQDERSKKVKELLNFRKGSYEKSPISVATDDLNIKEVAYEIVSSIGRMQFWSEEL